MRKRYTVSDGKLVLTLEEAPEGGFVVTSPLNPELVTEAETISEAFASARDALKALSESRQNSSGRRQRQWLLEETVKRRSLERYLRSRNCSSNLSLAGNSTTTISITIGALIFTPHCRT